MTSKFKHLAVVHTPQGVFVSLQSHVLKLDLIRELAEFTASPDAQAAPLVIINGAGNGFFAAGADIAELTALSGAEAFEYALLGQRTFNSLASLPGITVAAIDGFCMGGGLDLSLSCTFRYATPKSILAHPGGRIGIMTGWGGTRRLPLLIGRSRALELMAAGQRLSASEALEWRLVDAVVDDPAGFAIERHAAKEHDGHTSKP